MTETTIYFSNPLSERATPLNFSTQTLFPPESGRNSIVIRCFFWALAKGRGYLAVPFRGGYLAASLWVWGKVGGLHACGATLSYIVPPPILLLNPFLSEVGVKRKDFPEVARLT
jgi:hypothetical protein